MFAALRRHQKWFWAAIIAVVIPSFVIFFTPDATLRRASSGNFGTLYGRVITQDHYAQAYREAELRYLFSYGSWPSRDESSRMGFDIDRETRNRLLIIDLIRQNQIQVSDEAAAQWIANAFRDRRQRVFRLDSYEQFVKKSLLEHGMRERDFERFARNEVGVQQLVSTYGLNGKLVTPREAEIQYRREHEEFETEAAIFSLTNYLAGVNLAPDALSQFYSNRLATYKVPERVQVRYIKFELTNYLAEADQLLAKETNLTQIINGVYQQQGPNYFTGTDGKPLPEAEAKVKIKEQLRRDFAQQSARKKAGAFAVELFKMTNAIAGKVDNLNLMASNQFAVTITEPFSEFQGPQNLAVMENFSRSAFQLTPDEPFAPPLNGEDGVYIIGLDKRMPSEIPSLEAIKERVTEDYRKTQALSAARQFGEKFGEDLTNSLAAGKTFEQICKDANITPVSIPKFSLSNRSVADLDDRLEVSTLKEMAASLPPGKASRFTFTRDGGYVLYLKAKLPVDEAALKKDLPDYVKSMRQSRTYEAFASWLNQQITEARMTVPGGGKTAAN